MEITGKIVQIFPAQTGNSARGEWKKQEFILETLGPYPKMICFANWNDKIDLSKDYKDKIVKVFFDIESREYNGRWYTDVKPWKIEITEQQSHTESPSAESETFSDNDQENINTDDLPF